MSVVEYIYTLRQQKRRIASIPPAVLRHERNVLECTILLVKSLDLSSADTIDLMDAALHHDIGKVSIPPDILFKQGQLTDEERLIIQRHPDIGASSKLLPSTVSARAREAIRSHHERWDGTGYPRGLAGDQIHLFAQILAVMDVYEAMTSCERTYREPVSHLEALDELERCAGSQFSPLIVQQTIKVFRHQSPLLLAAG
ncbi:HD domain-containing protein [Candidatus Saccharibacteria bacterium]|nr:HD domain-containing protein [Candidatus Saccharibacteria bacterium]